MDSSSKSKWNYDVFTSFRGEDTRSSFTSHLHMALFQKGVNIFIDDKLQRGEEISESILKSIENSMISIVVFSENYASSTWCLGELVKIIECMESKKQVVFPVFYKVDPSDVRKQTGIFGEALTKHEVKFMKKIQKWREVLTAASNLSGWNLGTRKEADLIQNLVEEVLSKLNRTPLYVAKYPVGISSQLQDMQLLSHVISDGVNMVGIYGIGGIGKTTLAKAIFNKIANQFEGCSFLSNVREASKQFGGLVQLQEKLLYEILEDDLKVGSLDRGINIIRCRLGSKKVLILLDDVDKREQLEALVGGYDWFGSGSKIIVTTRDKHLLSIHGFDKIHAIQGWNQDNALELFSWHAFKKSHPSSDYLDLSERAVNYCKGLPLALVVLGSFLCMRDRSKWKSILDGFENSLNKDIKDVLKISFDGLEDSVKDIFLDISCFFKGENVNDVKNILEACNLNLDLGITVLVDLSLVTVENLKLQMHDLVQQMGQGIVHGESSEPGNRSRLWTEEDVTDVLIENSGTNAVKAIKLDLPEPMELDIDAQAFRNMKNLRLLIVRNATFSTKLEYLPNNLKWIDWPGFAFPSFPSSYSAKKLVGLNLQRSFIKCIGKGFKNCESLKHVDLSYSKLLEEIPEFSRASNLETLYLKKCTNLRLIHESVGSLGKLVTLVLEHCSNLEKLPCNIKLKSLKVLNLSYCEKLEEIPDLSMASNLEKLYHKKCSNLRIIHESVGSLGKLITWDLEHCSNLEKLPSCLTLNSLEFLNLAYCKKLEQIPHIFGGMESLRVMFLKFTSIKELPSSIGSLSQLTVLSLDCTKIMALPCSIHSLENLRTLLLRRCSIFDKFPVNRKPNSQSECASSEIIEAPPISKFSNFWVENGSFLHSLTLLDLQDCNLSNADFLETLSNVSSCLSELLLSGNKFSSLPSCLQKFTSLRKLQLRNCEFLEEIPNLPKCIQEMDASGCKSLARIPDNIAEVIISSEQEEVYARLGHQREFILMNSDIPKWYIHQDKTNSISIFSPQHPCAKRTLVPCVVFKVNGDSDEVEAIISCTVTSNDGICNIRPRQFHTSTSEYMWLQSVPIASGYWNLDQNQIDISFKVSGLAKDVVTVRSCGVYVIDDELDAAKPRDLSMDIASSAIKLRRRKLRQSNRVV